MATRLIKPVKRLLLGTDRYNRGRIIELIPGDEISFRRPGKRTRYIASLWQCELVAIGNYVQEEYKRKMDDYKKGLRRRKPKPPTIVAMQAQIRLAMNTK